jgi:uncharacterized membrane protein YuzA (DUF378 family)
MARTKTPETSSTPAKEPGRIKQMYQVFTMTRRNDPSSLWWMIAAFALPVLVFLVLAFTIGRTSVLSFILYIFVGVLAGVLLFMIALGRLAERAAYSQIEGEPGAVGAGFKSGLRRQWRAGEMPVAVNSRSKAAVYRAVGRPGVVLVTEGTRGATAKIVEEEKRKVARITPGVPITVLSVGPDEGSVPLHKLGSRMNRIKSANPIGKNEVLAVSNRLESLGQNKLPIPKGVDPMRMRSGRPR